MYKKLTKIDPSRVRRRIYPHRRDADQQMQLVFYSNYAGRLVLGGGQSSYWCTEVYPIESIKEFEQVSIAWKSLLARLLKKGFLYDMNFLCGSFTFDVEHPSITERCRRSI